MGVTASSSADARREIRARYVPEWSAVTALSRSLTLDALASANLWASTTSPAEGPRWSEDGARPYRAWARLSGPRFEVRVGLQKLAFGSANMFRPLMWFDQVDPRDPLQLSEGVWGVLTRVYFPGNVTAWAWGVRGEEDPKGWEILPTADGTAEAGGRLQVPFGPGELAATYHHRRFDLTTIGMAEPGARTTGDEDRIALDGRWDLNVGMWFEAAFVRQSPTALEREWTRAVSVGADYTLDVGDGLTLLAEHLDRTSPTFAAAPGGSPPPEDVPSAMRLTSFTANYPLGVLDRVSLAVYREWEGRSWLRLVEWRRTYDRWRLHVQGFWNPGADALFPIPGSGAATRSGAFTGTGLRLITVFNH